MKIKIPEVKQQKTSYQYSERMHSFDGKRVQIHFDNYIKQLNCIVNDYGQ